MNKEVIYVRLESELKIALDMIALEEQRSLNNLVVYILTKYVDLRKLETARNKQENANVN